MSRAKERFYICICSFLFICFVWSFTTNINENELKVIDEKNLLKYVQEYVIPEIKTETLPITESLPNNFQGNFDENLIQYSGLDIKTNDYLKNNVKCWYKPLIPTLQQKGNYWVLSNFIRAEIRTDCYNSVTFTTQAEYSFLDNLIPLMDRWKGPISVSVYAPGDDFYKAIDAIAYLRECTNPLIKKYTNFHIFFDGDHVPTSINEVLFTKKFLEEDILKENHPNCSSIAPYLNVNINSTYRSRKQLTYPINVARNIARDCAQTYFFLPADIELYPSPNLISKFLNMVAGSEEHLQNKNPHVFVLPIFEIESGLEVPKSKTMLQNMLKNGTAIRFHQHICDYCHFVPNLLQWIAKNETDDLQVFHSAKRKGKFKNWEPFYIGTHGDPYYDERLNWEGMKNKMTQGYAMCVLDYDYKVLDNAFLCHKPGIKKTKTESIRWKMAKTTNKIISKHILPEMKTLYGISKDCGM